MRQFLGLLDLQYSSGGFSIESASAENVAFKLAAESMRLSDNFDPNWSERERSRKERYLKVFKGAVFCSGKLDSTESLRFSLLVLGLGMGAECWVGRKEIRHGKVCDSFSWTPVIPGQGRHRRRSGMAVWVFYRSSCGHPGKGTQALRGSVSSKVPAESEQWEWSLLV